jgi:1-deoxy-D-xylulose-5-phosphate reductoisomerase
LNLPEPPRKVIVLGVTGSVGTCALNIIRSNPRKFELVGAAANTSSSKLLEIQREFSPGFLHLMDSAAFENSRGEFPDDLLYQGMNSLVELIQSTDCDLILAAMVGNIGLLPVLAALETGLTVALANKETLVAGGHLVKEALEKNPGSCLIPVDSEHSAIFQCLQGQNPKHLSRILLTASGGTFRTTSFEDMKSITPQQALQHPNWDMGAKITIDSSTLMNKGLEVIEAYHLFEIPFDQIEVVVHPQSIIHSMVEFHDRSFLAHLGVPDMTIPTAYALSYPARINLPQVSTLDFASLGSLTFEPPDLKRFPCLTLAYESGKRGGLYPAVLNAANEVAVASFLSNQIKFLGIPRLLESVLDRFNPGEFHNLEAVLDADDWARKRALELCDAQTGSVSS